jgi:YD repeat-containing protein
MVANSITKDGTYGRKLFYESRGYTVTDCYNQKTDNNGGNFTFAKYKTEIDAGRPVMINLQGHTIVGVGYDDSSNKVYIHDTWDYSTKSMTWGGSYSGMVMRSVSIVNLSGWSGGDTWPVNLKPLNGALIKAGVNKVKMTWKLPTGQKAKNIKNYEVQLATDAAFTNIVATKSPKVTNWTYTGLLPATQYYWRVRAIFKSGVIGDWSSDNELTSFSTQLTKGPTLRAPGNKAKQVKASVALKWKRPTGCPSSTSYVLQYSTDPTFTVGVTEESGLLTASYNLTTLPVSATPGSTFYYWRVKAYDSAGTKEYSNWSAARSFRR